MARKNPIFKIKKKNRRALDDIKNYLNINFYEKNLKNWIFPGRITAHMSVRQSRPERLI